MLTIENNGPLIVRSNYWDSELNDAGKFYLSVNAGAFRLLVSDSMVGTIKAEAKAAKEVIVSIGAWPATGQDKGIEILLEDGTDNPYALHLSAGQIDRIPDPGDDGRRIDFTAWGRGPVLLAGWTGRFRFVENIPYLRPWGK